MRSVPIFPRRNRADTTARVALAAVLGSETFFFGTLLASYLYMRADQSSWPSIHFSPAQLLVPGGNTLLLIFSAITALLGLLAIRSGKARWLEALLWVTLALGVIFVGGQAFEYLRTGMQPSDHTVGGIFFALMGFHALHMIAGIGVQSLVLFRTRLGDFSARKHIAVEIGAWFWLYVVLVWVVLFAALYLF